MYRTPTEFEQRVYKVTRTIPKGKVTTYKLIANAIGSRAYQAVGKALSVNPYPGQLDGDTPCHRVIASDGHIGGFFGATDDTAVARKRALLESEGVVVVRDKVAKEYIYEPIAE